MENNAYNVGDRFQWNTENLNSIIEVAELIHININEDTIIREDWIATGVEDYLVPNYMAAFRILEAADGNFYLVGKCFTLDITDIDEHMVRVYENVEKDLSRYPHICEYCGKPAYVGGCNNIECSNINCFCHH